MTGAGGRRLDIVVIGAGIVGVCCAAYLQREGHAVTMVDRLGPGEGASKGNAGALSPGSCVPLAMPGMHRKVPRWLLDADGPLVIRPAYLLRALPWLVRFSLAGRASAVPAIADALRALHAPVFDCYAPLTARARAESLIRRSGCLVVYETTEAYEKSASEWELRRARGVRIEAIPGGELRQMEPALSPHFRHGVLLPDHGFTVDPYQLVSALAEQFARDGGRFARATVRDIAAGGHDRLALATDGGTIAADRVVLAAGAWSRPLAAALGASIPLETQRGYHVTLPRPGIAPRLPVASAEGKYYATPMAGGLRVAGTVEFAGLDAPPNYQRARRLLAQVRRMYPAVETRGFTEWMGHRPCFPDSLPVIGPAPRQRNVVFAFGHGHHGMTSGPVTGRLVADLIAGRRPFINPTPYRPERFT